MLEALLGNRTKEKVLLYLYVYGEGYAQEIRRRLRISLRSVQLQLKRLEEGRIIFCRKRDRALVYRLNTGYPFYRELAALLEKYLMALSFEARRTFYTPRLRPRRQQKPL